MAKAILPTNFQDDILDSSMDGKRRYKQTTNADGTVSLEDASTYGQVGSNFGASQLNAISKAVNESADSSKIISDPDTASATTEQGYIADVQLFNHLTDSLGGLKFGTDGEGNYGYFGDDDVLVPFSSMDIKVNHIVVNTQSITFTVPKVAKGKLIVYGITYYDPILKFSGSAIVTNPTELERKFITNSNNQRQFSVIYDIATNEGDVTITIDNILSGRLDILTLGAILLG